MWRQHSGQKNAQVTNTMGNINGFRESNSEEDYLSGIPKKVLGQKGGVDISGAETAVDIDTDGGPEDDGDEDGDEDEGSGDEDDESGDEDEDEGSGDEDNEHDSQGEILSENPSEDILGDIINVLDSCSESLGTFGWAETLQNSPNPCLNIAGIGVVGIPLSERDAKALIGVCKQAPFGKGEHTVVDTSVRNTWELDPSAINFQNLSWNDWIESTVVPKVCEALGVRQGATPIAELYKLLLYETGSHFLPHQDTEKSPGMFATIVIVLPSKFTGGSLHLSHGGQTKLFDLALTSSTMTSVLSWYTDVYHAVNPVLSGYRLALSYNLIHPPSSRVPKPILPNTGPVIDNLRRVLLSWRQSGVKMGIHKLVYVLDHQYSQAGLKAEALKGPDAHILGFLEPIADQLGFQIYLANLEMKVTGVPSYGGSSRYGYGTSDVERIEMDEVIDSELTIGHTVDLSGIPVKMKGIGIDEETEVIHGVLDDGNPDQREYEGYMGNYGGEMIFWYRRSALIIWPRAGDFDVEIQDITTFSQLSSSTSTSPTPKEANLVELLMKACGRYPNNPNLARNSCQILRSAAIRWLDPNLWHRAIAVGKLNSGIKALSYAGFVEGLQVFGLRAMEHLLHNAYKLEPSNLLCFELLQHLKKGARLDEREVVQAWCNRQWDQLTVTLRKPVFEDVSILTEVAKIKGIEFIQDKMIPPLLCDHPDQLFWTSFASTLISELGAIRSTSSEASSVPSEHDMLSHIVTAAINSIKVLRTEDVDFLMKAAKQCGAAFVRDEVLPQIVCLSHGEQAFWIAFTRAIMSEQDSIPDRDSFDSMLADVVIVTIDSFEAVSSQDVDFLVDLAKIRGVGFLRDLVLPHLARIAIEHNNWGTLLTRLFEARELIPPDVDAVTVMVSQFVQWSASTYPFPVKRVQSTSGLVTQPNVDAIVDLVLVCLTTNNEDDYSKLVSTMHSVFLLDSSQREYRSFAYYIPLAKKLHNLKTKNDADYAKLSKTVLELFFISIKSTPAFPVKKTRLDTEEPDIHSIIEHIQLCLALDMPLACSAVFTKMKYAFDRLDVNAKVTKLKQYYVPLVQEMEKSIGSKIHKESFAPFYEVLAATLYQFVFPTLGSLASPIATHTIVSVFKRSPSASALFSENFAALLTTHRHRLDVIKDFAVVLDSNKTAITTAGFDNGVLDAMIDRLVKTVIDETDIKPKPPQIRFHPYGHVQTGQTSPDFSATLQLLHFCALFSDRVTLSHRVLQRLLVPPSTIPIVDWITKYLMEFVPILENHLRTIKQKLTSTPYSDFCVSVMRRFLTTVLKTKPATFVLPPEMINFGCGCNDCLLLRKFFSSGGVTMSLSRVQAARTHLERVLVKVKVFGVTWQTIRIGSPHRLEVTKPEKMVALDTWRARRDQGTAFMKKLGDDKEQRKFFGSEHGAFVLALKGRPLPPPAIITPVRSREPVATPARVQRDPPVISTPYASRSQSKHTSAALELVQPHKPIATRTQTHPQRPVIASHSRSKHTSRQDKTHQKSNPQPLSVPPANSQHETTKRQIEVHSPGRSSPRKRRKYSGPPPDPEDIIDLT